MTEKPRPIAIYHEHPDWFRPLFAELDRRGTPCSFRSAIMGSTLVARRAGT